MRWAGKERPKPREVVQKILPELVREEETDVRSRCQTTRRLARWKEQSHRSSQGLTSVRLAVKSTAMGKMREAGVGRVAVGHWALDYLRRQHGTGGKAMVRKRLLPLKDGFGDEMEEAMGSQLEGNL